MIAILPGLSIPENELTFTASRSGGPGGQNVNKVSTKVTLAFYVDGSAVLSDEQKRRIKEVLASRINQEGILQIASQRTRSQEMNRIDATERFSDLIRRALTPRRARVKTRVPKGAKENRLEAKRKHALAKQARSKKTWE